METTKARWDVLSSPFATAKRALVCLHWCMRVGDWVSECICSLQKWGLQETPPAGSETWPPWWRWTSPPFPKRRKTSEHSVFLKIPLKLHCEKKNQRSSETRPGEPCNVEDVPLEGGKVPIGIREGRGATPFHLRDRWICSWCCCPSSRWSAGRGRCRFSTAGRWRSRSLSSLWLWALWPGEKTFGRHYRGAEDQMKSEKNELERDGKFFFTSCLLKYFNTPSRSERMNFRLRYCPLSRPRFHRNPSR